MCCIYSTSLVFLPRYHKCLIHYRTNKCWTRRYWRVFFSSSLSAVSLFVVELPLKTSLSWAFHLLPFSSPHLYLKSVVTELVKCHVNFVKETKLWSSQSWTQFLQSIINRTFLEFFLSLEECVVFILPFWSFYQGTTSAPSTMKPTSAEREGIGEFFFFFTECSFLVCKWTSTENFIVMGF